MKRYTSREQILKDIDSAHRKIAKANVAAQEHLDNEEFLRGATESVAEMRQHREAADFQFRKIERLKTKRLVALGAKLAEFDTRALFSPGNEPASGPHTPSPLPPEPCDALNDVPP